MNDSTGQDNKKQEYGISLGFLIVPVLSLYLILPVQKASYVSLWGWKYVHVYSRMPFLTAVVDYVRPSMIAYGHLRRPLCPAWALAGRH